MEPVLEQFLSEARENLCFLDQNLPKLSDSEDDEMLNAIFRAAHTLKGGAGLVGLEAIKTITHYAEDLFDGIKKGKIIFTEDMLDVLYEAFDEIIEMVDNTELQGGIPEFDEDRVNEIADSVKALMGTDYHDRTQDVNKGLDTVLQISTNHTNNIAELVSAHNIDKYIKELNFDFVEITDEYICEENYYLVDFDLDEDSCVIGNDPVYLIFLLNSEDVYSVSTTMHESCENIVGNPTLWKTRLTVVVKSTKNILEDSLENVADYVNIYPLTVKSLLDSSYESAESELFEEFEEDFLKILDSGDYSELGEKLSAIRKILNPETKEGFIISRLALMLPNFEFESIDYLELVKYASYCLGIVEEPEEENTQEDEIEEDIQEEGLTPEKLTVIEGLKQQLKVLKYAKDDMALSRVRLHSKNSLEFIGLEPNFHTNDTKVQLAQKICYYILELHPQEDLSAFTSLTVEDEEAITKIEDVTQKEELKQEIEVLEEKIQEEVESVQAEEELQKEEILKEEPKTEEPKVVETAKVEQKEKVQEKEVAKKIEKKSEAIKNTATAIPKTVKIDQEDIDSMMDIIGELLVMKNSLPYLTNKIGIDNIATSKSNFSAKYEEINRVTEQLQDIIMGMRLLPLSYIFSRYPKLVRDTARKLKKKIRFEEFGGDTKLDKMMIEKIADPLVHIIRNSLDHGIETTPEDRAEVGKDPVGFIEIGAKSAGDKVLITIEDDGRGIDLQKVLIKALSMGITTEEQIEAMGEQEKLMMIFHPGLSTADEITDISGRGVGTDAVMKTIEELNGNIKLESKSGKGTKVTIELPVSVALTNVFCVKMGENNYAIAMENVIETIKVKTKDMQIANNKPYARLRGEIIPLVFEPRLLRANQIEEDIQSIVIVQTSTLRYGLVVNDFINQLDVVQKPLDGAIANHPMITGTSLLGNGEILFVLDVNKIVE